MNKFVKALGLTTALAVMIPLGASAAASAVSIQQHPGYMDKGRHGGHKRGIGEDVLNLLKLDEAALHQKLQSGKTLAQIATEQGVSRDSLKQAMTASFNKRLEERKKQFNEHLDQIIDSKHQGKLRMRKGDGSGVSRDAQ